MSDVQPAEETDAHRMTGWHRTVVRARRLQLGRAVGIALVALTVGVGVGRWSVPETDPVLRASVERSVQPLALDADAIWTSPVADEQPSIAEGIALIRDGDRAEEASRWAEDWLAAYDNALVRLTGLDLAAHARPVQRQFVTAVTLSRDAVEVLQHATTVDDPATRDALVAEALRLRQRAEHVTQAARASVRDLSAGEGDVSRYPLLPGLDVRD